MDFGWLPNSLQALVAASSTCIRSRMRLRSNSAKAPKMWKTSLPVEVEELKGKYFIQFLE